MCTLLIFRPDNNIWLTFEGIQVEVAFLNWTQHNLVVSTFSYSIEILRSSKSYVYLSVVCYQGSGR